MKLNSAKLKRALTVILLSATICSTLASCANVDGIIDFSDTSNSNGATDASDVGTENSTTNNGTDGAINNENAEPDINNNIIPLFADGKYIARVIRNDSASALERDIYNQFRAVLKKYNDQLEFCEEE